MYESTQNQAFDMEKSLRDMEYQEYEREEEQIDKVKGE